MSMVADPQPTGHHPYAGWPVALYTRASYAITDKSVSDQEAVGRQWVTDQRGRVFDIYCDNSKSASRFAKKAREDFERLVRDIKAGHIRIIWFWSLSRSQRRLGVYAELRDLCRERGVLWVVEGRVYNLADRGDRVASAITAILDEELPDQISSNVRRATAANAIGGKPHAHVPYGYQRVYEAKKVVGQEIREDQAAIVRDAATRFLKGEPLTRIAEQLNRTGVPAPQGGQWRAIQVRRLLSKPLYVGKRTHHGVVVADAIWPAIIDDETFYACQRKLNAQSEQFTRDNAIKHLLSGIALCTVCNEGVRVSKSNNVLYYMCAKRCSALRVDWLNDYIEDLTLTRLSRDDALEWLAEPVRSQDEDASDAETDLKLLEEQLKQLYDDAANRRISNTYGSQVEARLLPLIEAAKARAKVMRVSPVLRDAARPDIRAVWPGYEMPRKREIIRGVYEVVGIVPVGRGWNHGFDERRVVTRWRHELG